MKSGLRQRGLWFAAVLTLLAFCPASAQVLFVTDKSGGNIYSYTANGGGGWTQGTVASGVSNPQGLASDTAGNLYVALNSTSPQLAEYTPDGSGGWTPSIIKGGRGMQTVAASPSGQVLAGASSIYSYTQEEGSWIESLISSSSTSPRNPANAVSMTFDKDGNLYVGSYSNGGVYRFTLSGGTYDPNYTTISTGTLNQVYGLAFDAQGNLFAASTGGGKIYMFENVDGTLSTTPTLFASLASPRGMMFDAAGNLYVTGGAAKNGDTPGTGYIGEFTVSNGILSSTPTMLVENLSFAPTGLVVMVPEASPLALAAIGLGLGWAATGKFKARSFGANGSR